MNVTDHLGRNVVLNAPPQRIISLCPSQTSTLAALGVGNRLVGRTQYCIHPAEMMAAVTVVGGTKQLKTEVVEALNPDLIICEKEENTPEMVHWLEARYPVYVTDVQTIGDARQMVLDLGMLVGGESSAQELLVEIDRSMAHIRPLDNHAKVLYFIWRKPWMVAGAGTYIHAVLETLGFQNLAAGWEGRYPVWEASGSMVDPDYVFLSSEPFPFKEKHIAELNALFPNAKVMLVDGEMFSWYGEKMRELAGYWESLREKLMR